MKTAGVFPVGLGVATAFGDVISYPLLSGLSSCTCRMVLPGRERSCPKDLTVLRTVKNLPWAMGVSFSKAGYSIRHVKLLSSNNKDTI